MKHRHSGPEVMYRTRRGRVMSRKRPMHPITINKKREGRRGSRRNNRRFDIDLYTEEEIDYLRDTYNVEPEEIPEDEAIQSILKKRELEEE